jgi:sugar phosphate isomerase/epimerase
MRRMAMGIGGDGARFPPTSDIARWLEALGLRAIVPGGQAVPPPASELRRDLIGFEAPAVRHPCHPGTRPDPPLSLSEPTEDARSAAVIELQSTRRFAAALKSPFVIVELGRPRHGPVVDPKSQREVEALLDRTCRTLHAVLSEEPAVDVALALPRERCAWLDPRFVEAITSDLGRRRRVAWWHDSGRAHAHAVQGGPAAAAWLDVLAGRCVGLDATDAVGEHSGLPAGAGEVDLAAVLGSLPRSAWVVVRAEPFPGAGPLLAAVRRLRGERD